MATTKRMKKKGHSEQEFVGSVLLPNCRTKTYETTWIYLPRSQKAINVTQKVVLEQKKNGCASKVMLNRQKIEKIIKVKENNYIISWHTHPTQLLGLFIETWLNSRKNREWLIKYFKTKDFKTWLNSRKTRGGLIKFSRNRDWLLTLLSEKYSKKILTTPTSRDLHTSEDIAKTFYRTHPNGKIVFKICTEAGITIIEYKKNLKWVESFQPFKLTNAVPIDKKYEKILGIFKYILSESHP